MRRNFESLRRKFNSTRRVSRAFRTAVLNTPRKSFINHSSVLSQQAPTIISINNIDNEMKDKIIDVTDKALHDKNTESDVATYVKTFCDNEFGPTWHCIIGRSFGSHVSYEKYLQLSFTNCVRVVIFKCG
ncbi:Dynein, light chain, LC8-type 2 [Strongyloides ratti]|uniref:Dynein light chain n=1 Tax=Strongyloides ratti TaxID=34506 RepID=A0A090N0H5_STRRB|nr:Dynein, light chain, LC8-type 2 [Strongyloides ratti]CEF70698.1 Dynein, light chain, LC8-type 2 [Strongyloides ratti]